MSDATQTSDVLRERLQAFFKPEELHWKPSPKEPKAGDEVRLYPVVKFAALLNRLDDVFGVGGWSEATVYDEAGAECQLDVTVNGATVCRTGRGNGGGKSGDKEAADNAVRDACYRLGIGRYLSAVPEVRRKWTGTGYDRPPSLPQWATHHDYRETDTDTARRLHQLAKVAAEKCGKDEFETLSRLVTDYGYPAPTNPAAPFGDAFRRVVKVHASEMLRRLGEWIEAIGKGDTNPPCSPWHSPAAPPKPEPAPVQLDKPAAPAAATGPTPVPVDLMATPEPGHGLVAWLDAADAELAARKWSVKGALKAHVLECGAKNRLSPDLTKWNREAISCAVNWCRNFAAAVKPRQTQVKP